MEVMGGSAPLLSVRGLKKYFTIEKGMASFLMGVGKARVVRAIDSVSFEVSEGEIFGVAGQSGSGKTTLGETIARLYLPTAGQVLFEGMDVSLLKGRSLKEFRRKVQIIFQNPYESHNPRFTVLDTVEEPLKIHGIGSKRERAEIAREVLEKVSLGPPEKFLDKYVHELSGGERQRLSIARALTLGPKLLIADEPTSMLDVSIRAGILNLLRNLNQEAGLTILIISHDLSTLTYLCRRIAIMYAGRIVEIGPAPKVIDDPRHSYTQALLAAVPDPDPDHETDAAAFRGRGMIDGGWAAGLEREGRYGVGISEVSGEEPKYMEVSEGHYVICEHS